MSKSCMTKLVRHCVAPSGTVCDPCLEEVHQTALGGLVLADLQTALQVDQMADQAEIQTADLAVGQTVALAVVRTAVPGVSDHTADLRQPLRIALVHLACPACPRCFACPAALAGQSLAGLMMGSLTGLAGHTAIHLSCLAEFGQTGHIAPERPVAGNLQVLLMLRLALDTVKALMRDPWCCIDCGDGKEELSQEVQGECPFRRHANHEIYRYQHYGSLPAVTNGTLPLLQLQRLGNYLPDSRTTS